MSRDEKPRRTCCSCVITTYGVWRDPSCDIESHRTMPSHAVVSGKRVVYRRGPREETG